MGLSAGPHILLPVLLPKIHTLPVPCSVLQHLHPYIHKPLQRLLLQQGAHSPLGVRSDGLVQFLIPKQTHCPFTVNLFYQGILVCSQTQSPGPVPYVVLYLFPPFPEYQTAIHHGLCPGSFGSRCLPPSAHPLIWSHSPHTIRHPPMLCQDLLSHPQNLGLCSQKHPYLEEHLGPQILTHQQNLCQCSPKPPSLQTLCLE